MDHTCFILEETPSVDLAGMVRIRGINAKGETLSLLVFTPEARELRDALNALDLGTDDAAELGFDYPLPE